MEQDIIRQSIAEAKVAEISAEYGLSREEIYTRIEEIYRSAFVTDQFTLSPELIEKLCQRLFGSTYTSMPTLEREEKKQLVRDEIYSTLQQTFCNFTSSKQLSILTPFLNKLKAVKETLDDMGLIRQTRVMPTLRSDAFFNSAARSNLLDTMQIDSIRIGEDRIDRFISELSWVIECTEITIQNITSVIKSGGGKSSDIFAESLVMPLANVYYNLTEKIPECKYSGSVNSGKGNAVPFIEAVLKSFDIKKTGQWLAEQFDVQLRAASCGEAKYATPKWLAT